MQQKLEYKKKVEEYKSYMSKRNESKSKNQIENHSKIKMNSSIDTENVLEFLFKSGKGTVEIPRLVTPIENNVKYNLRSAKNLEAKCNKACNISKNSKSPACKSFGSKSYCNLSIPFSGEEVVPTLKGIYDGISNFKNDYGSFLNCKIKNNSEKCEFKDKREVL